MEKNPIVFVNKKCYHKIRGVNMAKKYNFCTMVGNPVYYSEDFRDYGPETINKLKDIGVDTVLVNIAWSRPYIDAVTLEHLAISKEFPLMSENSETVEAYLSKIIKRVKNVHDSGLKAMGLFGLPIYVDYSILPEEYSVLKGANNSTVSAANVTCIQSEKTLEHYKDLVKQVIEKTDIDGIILYSYDELAEVCDEDSDCPRCKGIPLENRLPQFLNKINAYAKQIKPSFEIWWEPWELSASQVYLCLENLDRDIAISCHSTLHEVYFVNTPDIWLRNVGMMCERQNRKFIVEMFISGSGEDLGPIAGYPCPTLVYDQLSSLKNIKGVTGIKEYFGTAVPFMSVNEKMTKLLLTSDIEEYEPCITILAEELTKDELTKRNLILAWEYASQALLMTPWDMSWVFRFSNLQPYDPVYLGKTHFFTLMRTPWSTPSWLSNRRSYYIITEDTSLLNKHMVRDFDKRIKLALDYADKAINLFIGLDMNNEEIKMQCNAVKYFYLILSSRRNYMNLCNLLENNKKGEKNEDEIKSLLLQDIENAKQFIDFNRKQNVEHYYPTEKSVEGLKLLEKIYNDSPENFKNYFEFLKY